MMIIEGIVVQEECFDAYFVCDLNACKGACCIEGDHGAPVLDAELAELELVQEGIKPYLTPEGKQALNDQWVAVGQEGDWSTPLVDGGPCAYMFRDSLGIARCAIEKAEMEGKVTFRKPISCHLYPIRVSQDRATGMDILYYEKWEICSAACVCGEKLKLPVFRFVKDALIRRYGTVFYDALEHVYAGRTATP